MNLKTQIYEPNTHANKSNSYYVVIWNDGRIVSTEKTKTRHEAQTFADSYRKAIEMTNDFTNDLLNKYFNIS